MKTSAEPIKAVRDNRQSWEKQTIYKLANGCQITVECNQHYGDMVSRIDDSQGYWHCSSGEDTLPARLSWALDWITPIAPGHWQTTMVPNMEVS